MILQVVKITFHLQFDLTSDINLLIAVVKIRKKKLENFKAIYICKLGLCHNQKNKDNKRYIEVQKSISTSCQSMKNLLIFYWIEFFEINHAWSMESFKYYCMCVWICMYAMPVFSSPSFASFSAFMLFWSLFIHVSCICICLCAYSFKEKIIKAPPKIRICIHNPYLAINVIIWSSTRVTSYVISMRDKKFWLRKSFLIISIIIRDFKNVDFVVLEKIYIYKSSF